MVLVVLVRHGERLDEVDAAAWRRMRTEANRNDPPLTPGGVHMSRDAGERLAALIRAEGGGGAAGGWAAGGAGALPAAAILCQRFLAEETVRPGSRCTIWLHMGPSWLCI